MLETYAVGQVIEVKIVASTWHYVSDDDQYSVTTAVRSDLPEHISFTYMDMINRPCRAEVEAFGYLILFFVVSLSRVIVECVMKENRVYS